MHFKVLNKIAFQWDAYRPRVDRISQHARLEGGVCSGVGACSGGGGVCSGGGGLLRGDGPGGVCSRGRGMRYSPHPLLTESQTPVKT